MPYYVQIHNLKRLEFNIDNITVADLKRIIEIDEGIESDLQQLTLHGTYLTNETILRNVPNGNVPDGTVIYLLISRKAPAADPIRSTTVSRRNTGPVAVQDMSRSPAAAAAADSSERVIPQRMMAYLKRGLPPYMVASRSRPLPRTNEEEMARRKEDADAAYAAKPVRTFEDDVTIGVQLSVLAEERMANARYQIPIEKRRRRSHPDDFNFFGCCCEAGHDIDACLQGTSKCLDCICRIASLFESRSYGTKYRNSKRKARKVRKVRKARKARKSVRV
jgi:hypothetical protein